MLLGKRSTDEESLSRENTNQGTNAKRGAVTYTSEQLTMYREQYNAAKRASETLRRKLRTAIDAGLEVSQDDSNELSRLTAVTTQRRLVLTRARRGKPVDRRTSVARQEVTSLVHDPKIQELAKSGPYSAQQLAEYKRSFYDAGEAFRQRKRQLAKVANVRKVTKAEETELANLRRAKNLQKKLWDRARQGKPADYRVNRPKKSLEDLLESAKLHKIAQSSGYSVKQLAEAQRRYLDSRNTVGAFKRALADVEKAREVTPEEKTQLQTLLRAAAQQKRMFARMCRGRPADVPGFLPKKDVASLLKDPEIQRIAQLGDYSVDEVAAQKRGYLDARNKYLAAQRLVSSVQDEGGTLQPDQADHFLELDQAYQLQQAGWDRMRKGERVDPAVQPPPKVGRLGQEVAALRQNDPARHPGAYTPEQIAMYDQQHLAALDDLNAFQDQISAPERRGRPLTDEEEEQLRNLQNVYHQRRAEWERVAQGPSVDGLSEDRASVSYTAEQIAAYNQEHLDALRRLRAFDKKMAAAGHPPTADENIQRRALLDDFNEKKIWNRARSGKPVDRQVHRSKSARPQEARPDIPSPEQASPAKEDPSTRQPLQISGPRHLLAPVLSSARHFLQGVGRQWRALLAKPRRLKNIEPAELLRAEHVL
ncbi:MAG: hypothetical protein M1826_000903 [Phylliscum demangeonii]|nr:MAG: hypothetical protein M1826_000903 [Phylliscum demangeonii]